MSTRTALTSSCGPRRRLGRALAAIALVATACGASSEQSPGSTQDQALVMTADGGQLDLGSFDGRDVVLWFWAPW